MKRIVKPLVVIALLAAASCSNVTAQEGGRCRSDADSQYLVVFWDRSGSTLVADPTSTTLADSLRILVSETIQCPGNQVSGFLVHGRTRGKAHRVRKQNTLDLPITSGPINKVKRDSLIYEMNVKELGDEVWKEFESLVESTPLSRGAAGWTDLLGTLEVLSEELAGATDHAVKRVYYFSDMFESMTGPGRRNFDHRPPRNAAEAREWARIDADFARQELIIEPDRFKDVHVRVLADRFANRSAADYVKMYWLTLFEELGFPLGFVLYN